MKKETNSSKKINNKNSKSTRKSVNIKKSNSKTKVKKHNIKNAKSPKRSLKQLILDYKKNILFLVIVIVVLVLIVNVFYKVFSMYRVNNLFAQNAEKIQTDIENPIFRIEKILIYSDANVEDLSEDANLSNINISQFTDFAIYINNTSTIEELTEENTVNNIYIDDITVTGTEFGEQKVSYKNVSDICIYKRILEGSNRIDFTVLHTNEEKEQINENNIFYTDCSEPFIISYVNENIVEGRDLSGTNEKISLDGSILRYLGIALRKLNYKISFTINIENNLGDLYQCDCNLNIDLDSDEGGLYTGYIMQIYDMSEENFTFRKQS